MALQCFAGRVAVAVGDVGLGLVGKVTVGKVGLVGRVSVGKVNPGGKVNGG